MIIWMAVIAPLVVLAVYELYVYCRYSRAITYKDMYPDNKSPDKTIS